VKFTPEQQRLIDEAAAEEQQRWRVGGPWRPGVWRSLMKSAQIKSWADDDRNRFLHGIDREPQAEDSGTFSNGPLTEPRMQSNQPRYGEARPKPVQWEVHVDRHLPGPPRLERERSRDGSSLNLSAIERNAKRLAETSRVYVDERNGRFYCAPHMKALLEKAIARAGV
jgi:hypothetical protein